MARTTQELTVVTSLNPFSRAPLQLGCFQAWKALGVRSLSANTDAEADLLLDMGLEATDILRLTPEQTGQAIHGKPVPRVAPLLQALPGTGPDSGPVAVVNSDLYPAMRSADGLSYWLDHMPAVALTREDCASPEIYGFADQSPYRGGLDAFVLSPPALARVQALIDRCASAGRMCFGIPGWDYVMAALILSPQVGGGLGDSGMLLHESHPTTYGDMGEFAHYLPDMHRLAGIADPDPTAAAAAFKSVIDRECERNAAHSRRVRTMMFTPPPARLPDAEAQALTNRLIRLSPTLAWACPPASIALLAARDRAEGGCDLTRARALLEINPDPYQRFAQRLLAILYCLDLQAMMPDRPALTQTYPPGNLHNATIRYLQELHPKNPRALKLEIALIFGAELVEHGIFNPRIYNYLVQGCETDEERRLLAEILIHAQARLQSAGPAQPHVERSSDAA